MEPGELLLPMEAKYVGKLTLDYLSQLRLPPHVPFLHSMFP
jgi:hypothetical protein